MIRHVLPNAVVATLTFLPFILTESITLLTSLEFLGFGLPSDSPSLGRFSAEDRTSLHAPRQLHHPRDHAEAIDLHRRGSPDCV